MRTYPFISNYLQSSGWELVNPRNTQTLTIKISLRMGMPQNESFTRLEVLSRSFVFVNFVSRNRKVVIFEKESAS